MVAMRVLVQPCRCSMCTSQLQLFVNYVDVICNHLVTCTCICVYVCVQEVYDVLTRHK